MNWRDGRPSLWGEALRTQPVDYDTELRAWEANLRLAETAVDLARERIETLKRARARAMLTVDYAAAPAVAV